MRGESPFEEDTHVFHGSIEASLQLIWWALRHVCLYLYRYVYIYIYVSVFLAASCIAIVHGLSGLVSILCLL